MRRLVVALLLAAAPATAATPDFPLGGVWFGQGEPQDKGEMFLVRADATGHIHVDFRTCRAGKAFDNTNDGTWSRSDGRLVVRYLQGNGSAIAAPHDDVYVLTASGNGAQTYRWEPSGYVFTARRKDADFQMPPCDLMG